EAGAKVRRVLILQIRRSKFFLLFFQAGRRNGQRGGRSGRFGKIKYGETGKKKLIAAYKKGRTPNYRQNCKIFSCAEQSFRQRLSQHTTSAG
ncbi:MAG: hypothetical protein L6Q97_21910, partial [Thermoanaerobaculia bacterium]|nr:hypothetical protein [Thermoanaerobaculia bacterium]